MELLLPIVIVILLITLTTLAFVMKRSGKEVDFPYRKNVYFMSQAERDFFHVLQRVVPERFYIFSQVSLNNLLLVDRGRKDYMHHFNRIRQKSVDFVLVDKSSMTTTLAIELDDRSHNYPDRIRRDEMVNEAFRAAGLPLLRITNQRTYDERTVQRTIEENVHGH